MTTPAPSEPRTTQRIPAEKLKALVVGVLAAKGAPPADAEIVADCLLTANLSGVDSHGVVRLAHYVRRLESGTITPRPQITFERRAPSLGIVDGGHGLGHVVAYRACTEAMALAAETGSGAVAIRNSSHFGMTGFYIKRLVEAGYMAMMMTDTDAFLIPFGSRKPFFGTNPIAFGFPSDGIPVILDMATTSIPTARLPWPNRGKPIPPDWGWMMTATPPPDPTLIAGLHPIAGQRAAAWRWRSASFAACLRACPGGRTSTPCTPSG